MRFFGSNQTFLQNYRGYVVKAWAGYYFYYDHFKDQYQQLKHRIPAPADSDVRLFDQAVLHEIERVHRFLLSLLDSLAADLEAITSMILENPPNQQDPDADHNIEVSIRLVYQKINQTEEFYKLNFFAISKIAKKIDKLLAMTQPESMNEQGAESTHSDVAICSVPSNLEAATISLPPLDPVLSFKGHNKSDTARWALLSGGEYFYNGFVCSGDEIQKLRKQCIALYGQKFRRTFGHLSSYELVYVKNKDRDYKSTRVVVGIKFGLIACIFAWFISDSTTVNNDLDFWNQAGLFVFTTIGNFLLYRLTWAFNVYLWSKFGVNYISVLQLSNVRPNVVMVVNQTASLLLIYALTLLLFLEGHVPGTLVYDTFLSHAAPMLLLLLMALFLLYDSFFLFGSQSTSQGVFEWNVWIALLHVPFRPVRFKETFAANVCTSFTRIFSDAVFAGCWVFTGGWLNDTAESSAQCTAPDIQLLASAVQFIPLTIRGLQCLRVWRDHHFTIYPYFFNMFKYLLSIIVVMVGITVQTASDNRFILALIIFSTLYKWWWDVCMDWGLCEILPSWRSFRAPSFPRPSSKLLLRHLIMYPSLSVYYAAIVADLIMRFMWTLSLVPSSSGQRLVGYQFSFFLGTIEILRRGMWACFRIEHEHLKSLKAGKAGFLSTTVIRKFIGPGGVHPTHSAKPNKGGDLPTERARRMSAVPEEEDAGRSRALSLASRDELRVKVDMPQDAATSAVNFPPPAQLVVHDDEEKQASGLKRLPEGPEGNVSRFQQDQDPNSPPVRNADV